MEKLILNLESTVDHSVREAYKTLRTNLRFSGEDVRVIAITSSRKGEGKTAVTLNLALSLAELGKKVLVIDADMRNSVMAERHANGKNLPGLSEVLAGTAKLTDSVCATGHKQLHLILSGACPPNPAELLSGRNFKILLRETRKVYDYVLIDTPPLGSVIDAAVVAPNCDGVILVVADNAVPIGKAREVVAQLRRSGCRILGAVRCSGPTRRGLLRRKK